MTYTESPAPGERYRILFFTKSKSTTRYTSYIIAALRRLGHKVRRINNVTLRRHIGRDWGEKLARRIADRFRPDACIIFSGDIEMHTLEYLSGRFKTAILLDDYFPTDSPLIEKIRRVDVFFHTMSGQLEDYRRAGAKRAVYVPSGVDPKHHRLSTPSRRFASEVAFIGKGIYSDRIELVQRVSREFDLRVYGGGWQQHGITTRRDVVKVPAFRRICASAKVILGIDKTAEQELYFSNRTWFVLGCGGFLLTRYVPGLERLFANHRHLVWFKDADEAVDLIRYYLARETERARIARAGYEFVHATYPFDRMARGIIDVLFHGRAIEPLSDAGPGSEERRRCETR